MKRIDAEGRNAPFYIALLWKFDRWATDEFIASGSDGLVKKKKNPHHYFLGQGIFCSSAFLQFFLVYKPLLFLKNGD